MSSEPTDIVEALWHRIWIESDLDALDELVADPYIRHTHDGTLRQTPAEYADVIGGAIDVIRGTRVQIDRLDAVGDTVWARMTLHAVNISVGNEVTITWLCQYRIEGERIAESWVLHESGLDWSKG